MPAFGQPDATTQAAWETERLFEEHFSNLVRYLRTGVSSTNDIEDIAQETFIRFFHARSNGEEIANPKGWIYRVGRHLMLDSLKKSRPLLLDEDQWKDLEAANAHSPGWEEQDRSLRFSRLPWNTLTAMEKECLLLRAQGLAFREVAEVLDVSISTVASYVARGLKKLRKSVVKPSETPKSRRAAHLR